MNRIISLGKTPKRVISLVPSQTEYLFDLGLSEEIVGITKFCIHPKDQFKVKDKIGGTKNLNFQKIRELKPDLIIGNKEENERSQIEKLMHEFPVWMSDINHLEDSIEMMELLGQIFDKTERANKITSDITRSFVELNFLPKLSLRVAYFIWKDPYMVAGKNTFIHDMLSRCGMTNVASELQNNSRYPEINIDDLSNLNVDCILLSSEPYPFGEKHIVQLQEKFLSSKIMLVDGEMFSWYGSRLRYSVGYFSNLLRTDLQ